MRVIAMSVCFLCFICSELCSAQRGVPPPAACVGELTQNTYQCDGPHNCHGQVEVTTGDSGDYFEYEIHAVTCCGQLFSDVVPLGDCEDRALLKDPRTRDQIDRAAKESPILIADCRGRYVPHNGSAGGPDPGALLLRKERELR
jgi:hypothetical protein